MSTAIYAQTGIVTYSGPHFSTFGMEKGLEYTLEYFKNCLMDTEQFPVEPSRDWSDDSWYRDQRNRIFTRNEGYRVVNERQAEGILLGGNLCTLNLLQGTEYMPSLADSILMIEDDYESKPLTFDRDLQSLIHQPGFKAAPRWRSALLTAWQILHETHLQPRRAASTGSESKSSIYTVFPPA